MAIHAPQRLTVPVSARDHIAGCIDAPLVLVKYGDYECPHCDAAHVVVKEIQHLLDDASLLRHAIAVGVDADDIERFVEDLVQQRYLPRIREDLASAARSGVNGTPSFFINGVCHEGGYDLCIVDGRHRGGAHRRGSGVASG
jgi:protein-disulfide isomerase